jgi:hypothetical protein
MFFLSPYATSCQCATRQHPKKKKGNETYLLCHSVHIPYREATKANDFTISLIFKEGNCKVLISIRIHGASAAT